MNIDVINAVFEFLAGFMILNHCFTLYKDKQVRGVSVISVMFFTLWGVWNLYYYPELDQWISFVGSILVVSANLLYVIMMLHHKKSNENTL